MKNFLYLLCFFTLPVSALSLDSLFNVLGNISDISNAKGDLSEENQKLFESLTCKFGVKSRKLKPKNSGLLVRIFNGYDQAFTRPYCNRVYLNDSYLNELTREEKKFLMAREITHSLTYPVFTNTFLFSCLAIMKVLILKNITTRPNTALPFSPLLLILSIAFLEAQIIQKYELEADKGAIDIGGISAQDGANYLKKLYSPSTKNWPLYAKLIYKIECLKLKIITLPIGSCFSTLFNLSDQIVAFKKEDRIAALKKFDKERNNLKKDLRINPMAF